MRSIKDLTLAKQLYEGLYRFDLDNKLRPALALDAKISEDALTYTFDLREAYWSNGDKISAYDFERSMKELLSPSFPTDYASMLFCIKNAKEAKMGLCETEEISVTAIDESTLTITLNTPTPYFLELTAFPTFYPASQQEGVVSGPFVVRSLQPDYALILEKNLTYWDHKSVSLDEIHFSMIADENTEALLFARGELDWLGQPISSSISPEVHSQLEEVCSYTVAGTSWLIFNTDHEILSDPRVRRALSIAIDRSELITHILQGGQKVATSPIPPSMHKEPKRFFDDGDLVGARELLYEVYCDYGIEKMPPLTLSFIQDVRNRQLAQTIQDQLHEGLFINIELQALESSVYRARVKQGNFVIAFGQWVADYHDPIAFLELFRYPRSAGLNDANWSSKEYSELLELADKEKDLAKRLALLREAEALLMAAMPIAPLYHYAFDYAKKEYVCDVYLSPLGLADFKYAKIRRK